MPTVLADDSWARVLVDTAASRIVVEWRGFALTAELQQTLELAADAVSRHGLTTYLADCRERRAVPPEAQNWMTQTWFPRLLRPGVLRKMAVVLPVRSVARTNMGDIIAKVSAPGFERRPFADYAEALAWLDGRAGDGAGG